MDFNLYNISPSTQDFMVSKQHPLLKSKGQKTSQFGDIKVERQSTISSQWNVMVYVPFKENVLFFLLEHGLVSPPSPLCPTLHEDTGINNSKKKISFLLSLSQLILCAFFHSLKLNLSHPDWCDGLLAVSWSSWIPLEPVQGIQGQPHQVLPSSCLAKPFGPPTLQESFSFFNTSPVFLLFLLSVNNVLVLLCLGFEHSETYNNEIFTWGQGLLAFYNLIISPMLTV